MELLFTMEKQWYYKRTVVLWKKTMLRYMYIPKTSFNEEKEHGRLPESIL